MAVVFLPPRGERCVSRVAFPCIEVDVQPVVHTRLLQNCPSYFLRGRDVKPPYVLKKQKENDTKVDWALLYERT